MSSQGVSFEDTKHYGTVRTTKEVALKGWFQYGYDPEGNIVCVRITNQNSTSIIPIHKASIEERPSRTFRSEVTE